MTFRALPLSTHINTIKKIVVSAFVFSFLLPLGASAQEIKNIDDVASRATSIGNLLIALAISFAVIFIIVSIVRYLIAGGEEGRAKGGQAILWGVVGLFVILSIWGLVAILRNSFRTQDQIPINDIQRVLTLPQPRGVNNSSSGGFIQNTNPGGAGYNSEFYQMGPQ